MYIILYNPYAQKNCICKKNYSYYMTLISLRRSLQS